MKTKPPSKDSMKGSDGSSRGLGREWIRSRNDATIACDPRRPGEDPRGSVARHGQNAHTVEGTTTLEYRH